MGLPRPDERDLDGDESVISPRHGQPSLLAARRGSDETKRLETDDNGNLQVGTPTVWLSKRYAYDANSDIEYTGKHKVFNADPSSPEWEITKFSRTGGEITVAVTTVGTWTGRVALFP